MDIAKRGGRFIEDNIKDTALKSVYKIFLLQMLCPYLALLLDILFNERNLPIP